MNNPLIDDIKNALPSLGVTLTTLGKFYDDDVFEEGTSYEDIEVGTLSIIDEYNMKDPFKLASGKAVFELLQRVVPSLRKPEALTNIDVELLLLASRIASYGTNYKLTVTCGNPELGENEEPLCKHEETVMVDLQRFITNYAPMTNFDQYTLELGTGQTVHLCPLTYKDVSNLMKKSLQYVSTLKNLSVGDVDEDISEEEFMNNEALVMAVSKIMEETNELNFETVLSCVHAVETAKSKQLYTDKEIIARWMEVLLPHDAKLLNDRVMDLEKGLRDRSIVEYTCTNCGYENVFNLHFNNERLFFIEPGDSNLPMKSSTTSEKKKKTAKKRLVTSSR